MFRMTIAAAAALMSTAASASSMITLSKDGSEARISYVDLNLGSSDDRTTLVARIRRAAGMVCFDPSNFDPPVGPTRRVECERVAVENGVAQMDAIAGQAG